MRNSGKAHRSMGIGPGSDEPTLLEHLGRIQAYLRGFGLLAFPGSESPLRRQLADFMDEHVEEAVHIWTTSIGNVLEIGHEDLGAIAADMLDAQRRWIAHIRNPDDIETYAVLRDHARGGFIAKHPPSRFLSSQLKIRQIVGDLMHRDLRQHPALPELIGLLDQEFWERVLHITDFFVEAREKDLADQTDSYRRSVDSAPAAMIVVEAGEGPEAGLVLSANQVAEREIGSPDVPVIGRRLWDLHPEAERGIVHDLVRETKERGAATRRNLHLEAPDHELQPVDVRTALIEYGANRTLQVIYVDLSERRRLEFQLIQSEKMAAIGQLAAGIAHEIRNPLGVIMNALYDLKDLLPAPSEGVREDLEIAHVEIARAQEIINNLLEFSRDSKTEIQAVDLNGLIERTLKLMNKYLQNSGVRAFTELERIEPCDANENGMRQVLLNLITNAVQAMPQGGELRVKTQALPSGRVRLSIADTGVGIASESHRRIFDPFYTTKEPGEGTGLGLSVVHSVIKNAGGSIEVRSTPGDGAEFVIEFPVHQPAFAAEIEEGLPAMRGDGRGPL